MATLDQLPPDRRAIIELVLSRGQSYEDLSGALGMPESRVREHAREALASLAPRSAKRVDPDWRGQIADYVLGQQAGPQAKATRSHLRSSEPARTWALSLLDSVGHLFPNGAEPQIPTAGRGREDGEGPRRAAAGGDTATTSAGRGRRAGPPSAGAPGGPREPGRRGPLSDEARSLVRRRRILAAVAGLVAVAGVVLLATLVFGGDDEPADEEGDAAAASQPEPLLTAELRPVGDTRGSGAAVVFSQQGQTALLARGRLPRTDRGETYGVWLFNDPEDAVPLPTQSDPRGNFQALGPVPPEYENYSFVDVSAEEAGGRRQEHSGDSLLRGPLESAEAAAEEGGGAPEAPALPTAPAPGGGG